MEILLKPCSVQFITKLKNRSVKLHYSLGSMQRKSSTQTSTGWRKSKIFSSAPQCSEGEWPKKMFYVCIMWPMGFPLVQSGAPLLVSLDPEGVVQCSPAAGVGVVVRIWQWAGVARMSGYSLSRFLGSLQICVCLNIEKRQEKEEEQKEKRMDSPRTPKPSKD